MAVTSATTTSIDSFMNEDVEFDYSTLSLYTKSDIDGLRKPLLNLLHDYTEEIEPYIKEATLTTDEVVKYRYNPKKMSFDYYKTPNLYFFILYLNNMSSIKEFTLDNKKVKLMPYKTMLHILSYIQEGESRCLRDYKEAL